MVCRTFFSPGQTPPFLDRLSFWIFGYLPLATEFRRLITSPKLSPGGSLSGHRHQPLDRAIRLWRGVWERGLFHVFSSGTALQVPPPATLFFEFDSRYLHQRRKMLTSDIAQLLPLPGPVPLRLGATVGETVRVLCWQTSQVRKPFMKPPPPLL